jgi:hypothetical protein
MFNFNRSASTGSAAPAAGTGFSFGNAASPTTAPPSGGFSFGGAAAAAPAASSGFSFGGAGAAAPAASSGFSFGGAGAAAPAASSGFSFGGAGAAAPAASSGFSFGGASSTAQQQPAGSGFGMTGFSSSFGAQPAAQQQQPQQASMDSQPGLTRIMELQLAYAPYIDGSGNPLSALPEPVAGQTPPVVLINKNCEFEFVFYDLIQLNSTTGAPMRRPKPSYISQRQWDRVSVSCLLPVVPLAAHLITSLLTLLHFVLLC